MRATRFDLGLQDYNVRLWAHNDLATAPTFDSTAAYLAVQTTVRFSRKQIARLFLAASFAYNAKQLK